MTETPSFAVVRGQVIGLHLDGSLTVGSVLGGSGAIVGAVLLAGNAARGLRWQPTLGDWVLLAYEPGQQPHIIAALLPPDGSALSRPLSSGEVRAIGGLSLSLLPAAPTPTAADRGRLIVVGTAADGIAGAADTLRVALQAADGSLSWKTIATG